MNKYVVIAFLIGILIGFGVSYCYFLQSKSGHSVQVGIFYYVWYQDGLGNTFWNGSVCWTVVDKPVHGLGWYSSQNETIIKQHFEWFRDLHIDFAIVSWWGWALNNYTDNSTKIIFETLDSLHNISGHVRLALMVEPFNENKTYGYYDYQQIYDYIYSNFAGKYPYLYFNYQDKPLICFFNAPFLTKNGYVPKDSRFTTIIVGHHYEDYCVDWVFEHITPHWRGPVPHDRTYSVCPRYDDSRLNRTISYTIDPTYRQQVYDREWRNALGLAKENALDLILINSWNEFNERSMIEPHLDATAFTNDTYFLYNKTKQYITELKGTIDGP